MTETLRRIKRMVLRGNYRFSLKAADELERDGLTELDAIESILNAVEIYKTIRSRSPQRPRKRELLHVIIGPTLEGTPIYTKGKIVRSQGVEMFYFLISSKLAEV